MLVFSRAQVEALLDPDALIDAVAQAMADLSGGRASMPARNFALVHDRGLLAAMPAYVPGADVLAAKLVLVFGGNASRGLETHQALIAVFDAETGVPAAIMDGAAITALRTAAGSALATRLCARDDAHVLAIVGTGVQARSHARLIPRVRSIAHIVVAGRDRAHVETFAASIGARAASSCEDAVSSADIVCTCTNASEPVVRAEWLRPGVHVNAVGFSPGTELDPRAFAKAVPIVESRACVIGAFPHGAPDVTQAIDQGLIARDDLIEIGELVEGRRTARTDRGQITIYRSVGVAVQDAAAAALVLRQARALGVGVDVNLA